MKPNKLTVLIAISLIATLALVIVVRENQHDKTIAKHLDKERYPKFYNAYLLAFKKMIINRAKNNKDKSWKTPEEVMNWWIYGTNKQKQDMLF